MGYFALQFQNYELESQYQGQQHKYIQKQSKYYIIILMIGKCISIIDNIRFSQYLMMSIAIAFILTETSLVYLIKTKRIDTKIIILYTNLLSFGSSLTQLIIYYFRDFFQLSNAQLYVQLDIIHQGITLFNYGQSHIDSSVLYIIFIVSKVFLQIQMFEYTSLSMTFSFYSLFYLIDQYQKAKQRRKQFLKSQRNKSLELLIQEFIDDRVCILEKDETNVRFISIMINDKIRKLTSDIDKMIKQLKIQKSSIHLGNYLYTTQKNNETLLCKYKKQFYEVTYQRFVLKKCQIFIKIKQIYQDQYYTVNYKELYQKLQRDLKRLSQSSYRFINTSYILSKFNIQTIIRQLIYILVQKISSCLQIKDRVYKLALDQPVTQCSSDKLLLNLLFKAIEKLLMNRYIIMKENKNIITIDIYGEKIQNIQSDYLIFINKLLFHIGIGGCQIDESRNSQCHIQIKLLSLIQKYSKLI
ncbi:hypothetical protein pb186bvf_014414 [Paramecium bursaria]